MSRFDELLAVKDAELAELLARIVELESELALSNECLDMANENFAALKAGQGEAVATYMGTEWDAMHQFLAECGDLEPGTELYLAPPTPDATQVMVSRELLELAVGLIEHDTHYPFGEPQ